MDTSGQSTSQSSGVFQGPFPEPFTEEEVTAILEAIYRTINTSFAKDELVAKTILVDFFGTQKSMKTATTGKVEQVFRRHKFRAYCPPETAEHEGIRSLRSDDPIVEQAKHLSGVRDQVLYLARHPRAHVAIISRGLIDMLYWYERGLRKGIYSDLHVQRIRDEIYELLKLDLVDSFFFFTCSVETAIKREYDGALTQKRGSKMNEKDIADTIAIYAKVLEGVQSNIPGLPIFHIDTSDMNLKQAGEEVLRFLLPTVCARFNVPAYRFLPYALSLVQKRARNLRHFEEQLKLTGHPSLDSIERAGWKLVKDNVQEDTYLASTGEGVHDPQGEILRLRHEDGEFKLMYKSPLRDLLLSHRWPVSFKVEASETEQILSRYKTLAVLKKRRLNFQKGGSSKEDYFFTLHVDSFENLGDFTAIRAKGSTGETHTKELFALAEDLGFKMSSVVESSYLSLALQKK